MAISIRRIAATWYGCKSTLKQAKSKLEAPCLGHLSCPV